MRKAKSTSGHIASRTSVEKTPGISPSHCPVSIPGVLIDEKHDACTVVSRLTKRLMGNHGALE